MDELTHNLEKRVKQLEAKVEQLEESWRGLSLVIGDEIYFDYRAMGAGQSFDHKAPANAFLTGWGYGHIHNDARAFARAISLHKP